MIERPSLLKEIEELERQAEDEANSAEDRQFSSFRATLLRSGYRVDPLPYDKRICLVVHLDSKTPVM